MADINVAIRSVRPREALPSGCPVSAHRATNRGLHASEGLTRSARWRWWRRDGADTRSPGRGRPRLVRPIMRAEQATVGDGPVHSSLVPTIMSVQTAIATYVSAVRGRLHFEDEGHRPHTVRATGQSPRHHVGVHSAAWRGLAHVRSRAGARGWGRTWGARRPSTGPSWDSVRGWVLKGRECRSPKSC